MAFHKFSHLTNVVTLVRTGFELVPAYTESMGWVLSQGHACCRSIKLFHSLKPAACPRNRLVQRYGEAGLEDKDYPCEGKNSMYGGDE